MTNVTPQDEHLASLAQKINGLELSDAEDAILCHLISGSGEEAEVAGFSDRPEVQMRGLGLKLGPPTKGWSTSGDADDRPTEEAAFYFTK